MPTWKLENFSTLHEVKLSMDFGLVHKQLLAAAVQAL